MISRLNSTCGIQFVSKKFFPKIENRHCLFLPQTYSFCFTHYVCLRLGWHYIRVEPCVATLWTVFCKTHKVNLCFEHLSIFHINFRGKLLPNRTRSSDFPPRDRKRSSSALSGCVTVAWISKWWCKKMSTQRCDDSLPFAFNCIWWTRIRKIDDIFIHANCCMPTLTMKRTHFRVDVEGWRHCILFLCCWLSIF